MRRLFRSFFLMLIVSTAQAVAEENASAPIRTVQIQQQAITQEVQLTGTVTSLRNANLSTASSGVVTKLLVDAGSTVSRGDVLLELDAELARWQWQSANANVTAARVAVSDAQRRLEEARKLLPKRSIAQSTVDNLAGELASNEASLEQAIAEASYRKALLARHTLRAPFAGVVQIKHTEIGEWVVPGNPVLSLVETDNLSIDFQVAEDYLSLVDKNASVYYWLDNDLKTRSKGRVSTVVPISGAEARTFLVRVTANAADTRLIPGTSARGELHLATGRQALAVPRDALVKRSDGRVLVWIVQRQDGHAEVQERPVTTGVLSGSLVEILAGLEPGAEVVIEGNESLLAGQRVTVLQ